VSWDPVGKRRQVVMMMMTMMKAAASTNSILSDWLYLEATCSHVDRFKGGGGVDVLAEVHGRKAHPFFFET